MRTTLHVEATGRHGDGVAFYEGRKLYIPRALAGDKAAIDFDAQGNITSISVLQSGSGHAAAECAHFPQCGGCKMQHMSREAYMAWKQHVVARTLEENGLSPMLNHPARFSPPQSRRRATIAAVCQGKKVLLGFNQARSEQVIDVRDCLVLRPELSGLLPQLRVLLADYMADARHLDIRLTLLDGVIDMVIIGGPVPEMHEREMLGVFAERNNIGRISWRKWDKSPAEPITQRLPVRAHFAYGSVNVPPGGFLQATKEGETALSEAVALAVGTAANVVDLYSGIGTFALALSPRPLTAYDGEAKAIEALQEAVRGRAKTVVDVRNLAQSPMTTSELSGCKALIFDPPRDGAKEQAKHIAASKVPVVVSVSCDLNSFCRDGKILQAGGYKLMELTLIDQFLWSNHVELVGVFRKA
ncbi:MAG: class I SAM-dependent RNA methyltransferase [Alphaproteobacteria bacterium]|nr:class I SAM-dependent RNA methyltransferase [Alphaproteobacteria bacterium]